MSIAVVTGAAGGIGMAISRALIAAGHEVAVVDLPGRCDEAASSLGAAFAATADVTDQAAVTVMAAAVLARGDVGIVVNNAGRADASDFESATPDEWLAAQALNLNAAYFVTRAFLPSLKVRGGVIVNVASVNGLGAFGNPSYSIAKAGLIHFTRQLAVEYGPHNIRAVSVVPGSVRTPAWDHRLAKNPKLLSEIAKFYPLRRIAEPEDVAGVVAFACSDAARSITGSELLVDCGLMAGNSMMADLITRDD